VPAGDECVNFVENFVCVVAGHTDDGRDGRLGFQYEPLSSPTPAPAVLLPQSPESATCVDKLGRPTWCEFGEVGVEFIDVEG
jgi:hypothetical protein